MSKHWSYINPKYFYEDMDLFDVIKLVPFLPQEEYELCWSKDTVYKKQDLNQLKKDGVING